MYPRRLLASQQDLKQVLSENVSAGGETFLEIFRDYTETFYSLL